MTGNHHDRKSVFKNPPQSRPMRGGKTAYAARSSKELAQDPAIVLTLHTENAIGTMLAAEGLHLTIHPDDHQDPVNVAVEGAQPPPDEVAAAGAQVANGPAGGDAQAVIGLAGGDAQSAEGLAGGDAQAVDGLAGGAQAVGGLAGGDAQTNAVTGGQAAQAQTADKRGIFKRLGGFIKRTTGKAFRVGQ
ncbi:unnamed protein product [Peniophora sp. CBMAI 1063]|nr:unnamed protein product [Peniophora sp. CBMAI 1063]